MFNPEFDKMGSLKLYSRRGIYKLAFVDYNTAIAVNRAKLMQNGFVGYACRDMINTRITNPERNVFGALIGIMLDYVTFSCRMHASAMSRVWYP